MTDKEALEKLFVAVAGSFQPFHWDKNIRKALDDADEVIGKERVKALFEEVA